MRRLLIPLFALICILTACDQDAAFERFVLKEEVAKAKEVIAKLAARDYVAVEAELEPGLRTADVRSKLEQAAASLPKTTPISTRTIGAQTNVLNSLKTYDLTFEYKYEHEWLIINTLLQRKGEKDGSRNTPYATHFIVGDRKWFFARWKKRLALLGLRLNYCYPITYNIRSFCLRKDTGFKDKVALANICGHRDCAIPV